MFDGVIDSSEVRAQRGSSSQSSSGTSRRSRPSAAEVEIARLREEIRQRDEYQRQCAEYQAAQQQYWAEYNARQQEAIQVVSTHSSYHFRMYTLLTTVFL